MLTDRAERFYRENRKRFLQGSLLLLALLWAYSGVFTQTLPIEGTILFGVAFIAFTMELVSRDVLEVNERVAEEPTLKTVTTKLTEIEAELQRPTIFDSARAAVDHQSAYIADDSPETVHFLEYNSTTVRDGVFESAMRHSHDVHLLIKDPVEAISEHQRDNIVSSLHNIFEAYYDNDRLTIHLYSKPASLKARRLGEDEICAGWYTFEHRDTNRESPIWGGDNPMVCVNHERNPAQHARVDDWFQKIYHDLWVTGRSPAELLDSEDCPDRLRRWANRSEEKERWIEQVSSDTDIDRATLFQR